MCLPVAYVYLLKPKVLVFFHLSLSNILKAWAHPWVCLVLDFLLGFPCSTILFFSKILTYCTFGHLLWTKLGDAQVPLVHFFQLPRGDKEVEAEAG